MEDKGKGKAKAKEEETDKEWFQKSCSTIIDFLPTLAPITSSLKP
jgi:hypothetical protein